MAKKSTPATISVVIPTCNRTNLLGRALDAAMAQTLKPLEIIVINDAGAAVEEVVAKSDPKGDTIKIINHTHNQGASAARNSGLAAAKGELIAFLDDDDGWRENHLEVVSKALMASKCEFAYGLADYDLEDMVDGKPVVVGGSRPYSEQPFDKQRLLVANYIPTPTWMFKRGLFDKTGPFDTSLAACEDWEWLLRAVTHTDFLRVAEHTVQVHQRLYDGGHLILQHRPHMNKWINTVYERHPVNDDTLRLARIENTTLGAAVQLTSDQQALVAQARADLKAGKLDLVALFNAGGTLDAANRRHESIALYREWLSGPAHPLAHAAWYNLGVGLFNLGQYDAAEEAYQHALAVHPGFHQARLLLAALYERRGKVDQALQAWRHVAKQEEHAQSPDYLSAAGHLRRYLEV